MPESQASGSTRRGGAVQFVLTFVLILLATQIGIRFLFPDLYTRREEPKAAITLRPERPRVTLGSNVSFIVVNNTPDPVAIPQRCPDPPLQVRMAGDTEPRPARPPVVPCTPLLAVPARGEGRIDLSPWKYSLFSNPGTYQVSLSLPYEGGASGDREEEIAAELRVRQPGFFTSLFRAVVTKPLYNTLLLIASLLPAHSLGIAIILLTILVKLLLYFPSQHALEGQRKLQHLQPKIEEIKRKHAGDQQRQSEETMQLWREHKVNPFQSCLPTLVQIPILIGLFLVIRDGTSIPLNRHLLYGWISGNSWQFSTVFLGFLDLTQADWVVAPLSLVLLQYWQMHLSFSQTPTKAPPAVDTRSFLERLDQRTVMLYVLPLMVGFFAVSLPAAVSLYWGTSTLFAIVQQYAVARRQS